MGSPRPSPQPQKSRNSIKPEWRFEENEATSRWSGTGYPDEGDSPCAVVFTLSINSGEDFEVRLECNVVDAIDLHPRRLERNPNYAVLRTTIADKIEPPLEDGDLVRFAGADVLINDEYRATIGGGYQERLDRDRSDLPPDAIEPTDQVDVEFLGETDIPPVDVTVDSVE